MSVTRSFPRQSPVNDCVVMRLNRPLVRPQRIDALSALRSLMHGAAKGYIEPKVLNAGRGSNDCCQVLVDTCTDHSHQAISENSLNGFNRLSVPAASLNAQINPLGSSPNDAVCTGLKTRSFI